MISSRGVAVRDGHRGLADFSQVGMLCVCYKSVNFGAFPLLLDCRSGSFTANESQRALPTETNVESGTSQSKSGTSVNLSNSGDLGVGGVLFQLLDVCVVQARQLWRRPYLTPSVFKVVLQKSIPTQIRQLILYISNSKG